MNAETCRRFGASVVYTGCPKKIVPFSKIFLWAPDVILESFIYQKLGNKSKFFSTLQRFNMGALRDTADI